MFKRETRRRREREASGRERKTRRVVRFPGHGRSFLIPIWKLVMTL